MLNFRNQTLLVVSPHPDDDVLGCGGLIKKVKDQGGKVYVLYVTVGDTREYSQHGVSTITERQREIEKVAKYLKYDDYHIAFPGNQYHLHLDQIPQKEIITQIERISPVSIEKVKPTIITTTLLSDYNQDHRSTTEAVFAACRPACNTFKPMQSLILGYESVCVADWWTQPNRVNFYVNLTNDDLETKISALKLFKSQIRNGNHARSPKSLRSLANYRGLDVGQEAAEAYYSYRLVC